MLSEILKLTGAQAAEKAKTLGSQHQTKVVHLLSKIKSKDHNGLIKFLRTEKVLHELRPDFEVYSQMSSGELQGMLQALGPMLPLTSLITAVFIVKSVANGEPISLQFDESEQAHPSDFVEDDHSIPNNDIEWFTSVFDKLTTEKITLTVSEWAESKRYLPSSVTSMPGFYSFKVTPFLRQIADCLSINSPIREVDIMKGAQVGCTVGILENAIGYYAEHIKGMPMMLLTAERELAELRMVTYILPMFQHSKMEHLIQSADTDKRKTGKTMQRLEFLGGGFLLPYGAKNANKLRSTSIRALLEDEVDTFPETVGSDGDPQELARARLQAFYEVRKNVRMSTPLLSGKSRIKKGYDRGDKRKYFVPCIECGKYQYLVFRGDPESNNGQRYGLVWDLTPSKTLDHNSVRYLCKFCGHAHRNADKTYLFERGEWRPTAVPTDPEHRSYHLPALYSPVGMYPWEAIAKFWIECWDDEANTVRDVSKLQTFYNNVLGVPFKVLATRVRFTSVSAHRRACYRQGEIPNKYAAAHCGSHVLFLVCTVDVHAKHLDVGIFGITRDFRMFLIEYLHLEVASGEEEASEKSSPVWGKLRAIFEEQVWVADDGKVYKIAVTLIDAGFANDTVSTFCSDYATGVFPILGRDRPAKNQTIKEFAEFETQAGTKGYRILVDHYKDRMAPVLRREWIEEAGVPQKPYHFNAPVDLSDKELKELTVEERREKRDPNGSVSYYWHRPGNARNELWDLLGYAHAAVEILAYSICRDTFELETIDWQNFWDYSQFEKVFFTEGD